jgi:hypothetical protein
MNWASSAYVEASFTLTYGEGQPVLRQRGEESAA